MNPVDAKPGFAERLAEMLEVHFDPKEGAPYWIETAARWPFDPRCEIHSIDDLHRLGLMDQQALRRRPLTDFLPRPIAARPEKLVIVQTGGTLGEPIWSAYTEDDYDAAFVRPFVEAAGHVGFPTGGTWLYVGPTGPHVIGRAARSLARATGAMDPFAVDFDSRWARKLPPGSFSFDRYVQHVIAQAMAVVETQPITHLFSTPPVLGALGAQMSAAQRARIRGVHYGGMAIDGVQLLHFQRDIFPEAVHLAGYGNTLFGCCLELDASPGRRLRYFPQGDRIIFSMLPESSNDAREIRFDEGARGRCVFTRLDASMLLINVVERDVVELVAPPQNAPAAFVHLGVLEPHPPRSVSNGPAIGIY